MCIFTQAVAHVSGTNIFARAPERNRQILVYSMTFQAGTDLAMVLPLPVPPGVSDDAVRFINLDGYADFFLDMQEVFSWGHKRRRLPGTVTLSAKPILRVHDVGTFEASFVPCMDDFDRLDQRFRLPTVVGRAMPLYGDYGFAVFRLKPDTKLRNIHPMAFEFPTRAPGSLFFPTVHVHDGTLPTAARFDHKLYWQGRRPVWLDAIWESPPRAAGSFLDIGKSQGVLAPAEIVHGLMLGRERENRDTWIAEQASLPAVFRAYPSTGRDA